MKNIIVVLIVFSMFLVSSSSSMAAGNGVINIQAGIVQSSPDWWNVINNLSGTTSLLDSDGHATSITLTTNGNSYGVVGNNSFTTDLSVPSLKNIMNGYMATSATNTLSFEHLDPNTSFMLVVYSQGGDVTGAQQTLINGSYVIGGDINQSDWKMGGNFIVIPLMTDGAGNLTVTYAPNLAGNEHYGLINALQLIRTSSASASNPAH